MRYLKLLALFFTALLILPCYGYAEYLSELKGESEAEQAWLSAYRNLLANADEIVKPQPELTTLWPEICTSVQKEIRSELTGYIPPIINPEFTGEVSTPYAVLDWYGEAIPIPVKGINAVVLLRSKVTQHIAVTLLLDGSIISVGEPFAGVFEPEVVTLEAKGDGTYQVTPLGMLQTVQLANQNMFNDDDCTTQSADRVVDVMNRYYMGFLLAQVNTERQVYPIPDERTGFIIAHTVKGEKKAPNYMRYRGLAEWEIDKQLCSFNITSTTADVANLALLFGRSDLKGQTVDWVDALSRALKTETAEEWAKLSSVAQNAGIEVRGLDNIYVN